MSLNHPIATGGTDNSEPRISGVDPFVVVAGLIVAILIASLLLWLNGRDKINDLRQPAASIASTSVPSSDV